MLTATSPKSCIHCEKDFTPKYTSMQIACSLRCAQSFAKKERVAKEKAERAETKKRKEAVKTRREWLDECQAIVNKIARIRDRDLPCCSCDRPASWDGQWHGSHFRSVGAASAVRLNLWNINKGCSPCNLHLSGNLLGYRPRLIAKRGLAVVEWLESQNQVVRYDIEYLKRFKAVMGKRLRRLEKRLEMQ